MPEQYYRHLDGGLYRFVSYARSADTTADVIVYEHLWPFEPGLWVRDRKEFEARFAPIAEAVVNVALLQDRVAAQAAVNNARTTRHAKNGSTNELV